MENNTNNNNTKKPNPANKANKINNEEKEVKKLENDFKQLTKMIGMDKVTQLLELLLNEIPTMTHNNSKYLENMKEVNTKTLQVAKEEIKRVADYNKNNNEIILKEIIKIRESINEDLKTEAEHKEKEKLLTYGFIGIYTLTVLVLTLLK